MEPAPTLADILVANKDSIYANKTIHKKDLEKLPLILLPFSASNRKNFDKFCLSNNYELLFCNLCPRRYSK